MSQHSKNSYTFEFCTYCATCEGLHEAQCGHEQIGISSNITCVIGKHTLRITMSVSKISTSTTVTANHISRFLQTETTRASSLSSPCPFTSLASTQASMTLSSRSWKLINLSFGRPSHANIHGDWTQAQFPQSYVLLAIEVFEQIP